jgi:3-keto-5-aminohexanoate cleavage enzyme
MNKLIITCAISGAEVTKEQNPSVPYTVSEMVREAALAKQAGASIIHLHVREDDGTPTQDKKRYKEVIDAIKKEVGDIIIQPSTGGAVGMSKEERIDVVSLGEEMSTLDCGSVNFGGDEVFINSENDIIYFANEIYKNGVFPELECFGKMHIDQVLRLHKKGIIKDPMHFSFVLGVPGGMNATERDFLFLKDSIPTNATYSVAGIGRHEFPLAELSIKYGGHVRVGLEDNLYLDKGVLAKSNGELVEKVVSIAKKYNREIASVKETRNLLKLGGHTHEDM